MLQGDIKTYKGDYPFAKINTSKNFILETFLFKTEKYSERETNNQKHCHLMSDDFRVLFSFCLSSFAPNQRRKMFWQHWNIVFNSPTATEWNKVISYINVKSSILLYFNSAVVKITLVWFFLVPACFLSSSSSRGIYTIHTPLCSRVKSNLIWKKQTVHTHTQNLPWFFMSSC